MLIINHYQTCQSQLSPAWDLVHSEPEDGPPSSLKIEEEEREQTDDNERDSSEHEEVGGGETNDGPWDPRDDVENVAPRQG